MLNRIKIGVTIGSANIDWLELTLCTFSDQYLLERFQPLLIGPQEIIFKINQDLDLGLDFVVYRSLNIVWPESHQIVIIDRSKGFPLRISRDNPNKALGEIAISSLEAGIKLAFEFKIDALVVGPICFDSIAKAGFHYHSVLQILSEWTRSENVVEEKQKAVSYFRNLPVVITSLQKPKGGKEEYQNSFKTALELANELVEKKRRK